MNAQKDIRKGGLSEKMSGFSKEPPVSVWEGVSSELGGKRSGRRMVFILAAAASIVLAASVSLTLIFSTSEPELLTEQQLQTESENQHDINVDKGTSLARKETEAVREEKDSHKTEIPETRSNLEERVLATMADIIEKEENTEVKMAILTAEEDEEVNALFLEESMEQQLDSEAGIVGEEVDIIEKENREREADEDVVAISESDSNERNPEVLVVNEDSLIQLLQESGTQIIPEIKEADPGKWSLGASVSPLLSYRDAAASDRALNAAVNSSESPKVTYSGGFQFSYHQSERLSFESGVYYSKMGVNIGEYNNFTGILNWNDKEFDNSPELSQNIVSISNSMGTIVSEEAGLFLNTYDVSNVASGGNNQELQREDMIINSAAVSGFSQSFEYLEIPFNVKYTILDRQLDIQLIGGLSTNLLLNNNISAYSGGEETSIGEVQNVRSVNYAGNAGLGLVYGFAKNFSLAIEPRFRYYLHSINLEVLPATRPYSFGLYTGVNYTF